MVSDCIKGNSMCHGIHRAVSFPGCLKWRQTAAKNRLHFIDSMKKIFRNSLSSSVLLMKRTFLPLDFVGNGRKVRKNSVTYQKTDSSVLLAPVLYTYVYVCIYIYIYIYIYNMY